MVSRKKLTPKQHRFCQLVVSGKSLCDAYRGSYKAENMKQAVVRNEASKLSIRHDVTVVIDNLRAKKDMAIIASTVSDKDRVLEKLRQLLDNPTGSKAEHVMLKAADLLGKSLGLYKNVTIDETQRSVNDVATELAAILDRLSAKMQGIDKDSDRVTH